MTSLTLFSAAFCVLSLPGAPEAVVGKTIPSATAPGPRGQAALVVSGPARLPPGTALSSGQRVSTGPGERVELLLGGRCLLRLAPSTTVELGSRGPLMECGAIRLKGGALWIATEMGERHALMVHLPRGSLTLKGGMAVARSQGVGDTLCLASGLGGYTTLLTTRATGSGQGGEGSEQEAADKGTAPPETVVAKVHHGVFAAGQCLMLGSTGKTVAPYAPVAQAADRELGEAPYAFATPVVSIRVDLGREVSRLAERALAGDRGGAEVEGGGQSMCLETGAEGSAGDLGSTGSVEIVKPPPAARLRLRVPIERTRP